MQRRWNWPDEPGSTPDPWVGEYGMPNVLAGMLRKRGFLDTNVDAFLHPRLKSLADPTRLGGMAEAVERVWRAVDRGESLFVHGDYDVDGITGTAFLARTLGVMGAEVIPYVPSRAHGYGLGPVGIRAAADSGAKVLITVDNGIRSIDEVAMARSAGLDVIILDHHTPGESLPDATAIVNPRLDPEGALTDLAAVGVAAKFVHAVAAKRPGTLPHETYKEALQLVALGTIADIVPLVGENRILVSHGLQRLARSSWSGVQALKAVAGLDRPWVSSTDVAFTLAPRINAIGRMGDAADALRLLLADDPAEAYRLADLAERLNLERRSSERRVTDAVMDRVRRDPTPPPAIVAWGDDWPVGVVGIVAARALERVHRPAMIIAMEGDLGRGSARSVASFPLPAALQAADDLLETHGGHAQAAGFSIRRENLEAFRDRMIEVAGRDAIAEPDPLQVEAALDLAEVDRDFVGWVERLGPFGPGNPEPLFGGQKLELAEDPSIVGADHLRLVFRAGRGRMKAIAFGMGSRERGLTAGSKVDAVFHTAFDTWRGRMGVQLIVRDLRTR